MGDGVANSMLSMPIMLTISWTKRAKHILYRTWIFVIELNDLSTLFNRLSVIKCQAILNKNSMTAWYNPRVICRKKAFEKSIYTWITRCKEPKCTLICNTLFTEMCNIYKISGISLLRRLVKATHSAQYSGYSTHNCWMLDFRFALIKCLIEIF